MAKKYAITLLSKNSGAYMHSADHTYIYLKCLIGGRSYGHHKGQIKRIFGDEYHIVDVSLILSDAVYDHNDLTLEGQKYQCYIDNTKEAFPKTFEEWVNT